MTDTTPSTTPVDAEVPVAAAPPSTSPVADAPAAKHRRKRLGVTAWLAIVWLVFIVGLSALAPVLPLAPYDEPDVRTKIEWTRAGDFTPSPEHPLGIDDSGRDVLSRLAWGGQRTMALAVVTIGAAILIGGTLGLFAGYFGGRVSMIITGVLDIMLALPQIVLALAIVAFLGQSFTNIALALTIVSVPLIGRITRANTLTYSRREFVTAAKALGAKHTRVMIREVLPNVMPAMFSIALLGIAIVIVGEGGLSIIGVGLPGPKPSWGSLIQQNSNFQVLRTNPWPVLVTSTVIFLTVLSLNYLGDVVRERFDVRKGAL